VTSGGNEIPLPWTASDPAAMPYRQTLRDPSSSWNTRPQWAGSRCGRALPPCRNVEGRTGRAPAWGVLATINDH
jgi:hypothetical protein